MSLYDIENSLRQQQGMFNGFFQGNELVANSQSGPLRDYYGLIQRYLGHSEASGDMIQEMTDRRDVTIRLLYFPEISHKFQEHYNTTLSNDYEQAGLDVPDFSKMNRQEFLQHLEQVRSQLGGTQSGDLLKRGLHDLNKDVILTTWV
jgi:hypothetical protein